MAPEVLRKQSGPEVDVWSAGVILYILLRGLPPFWASNDPNVYCNSLRLITKFFLCKLFDHILVIFFVPELHPILLLFSESESAVFKQILHGEVDFASDPWPSISQSAKDLIKQMLDKDPKKRISAHEVLCEFLEY